MILTRYVNPVTGLIAAFFISIAHTLANHRQLASANPRLTLHSSLILEESIHYLYSRYGYCLMNKIVRIISCLLCLLAPYVPVIAAEFCDDNYHVSHRFDSGSSWDMCWTHDSQKGVSYHHIFYTPKNESRRMVLYDASLAQIHVPYDDNGARYHDVSDFGLGENNLVSLTTTDCANGTRGFYNGKAAVCTQVRTPSFEPSLLKVFSVSAVGEYVYISEWVFYEDGRIVPAVRATGTLQRYGGLDKADQGWLMAGRTANTIGLSHMHNFFWRLDFDLNTTSDNDQVEEINFGTYQGKRYRTNNIRDDHLV